MAFILTLIFHGWLLLEEKHVEVGYISEAYSMLSCLFFSLFFFKCPWGTANQLAMEKQLSSPEIILIWCVTEHLIFLTVFQWMHFRMTVSIHHTHNLFPEHVFCFSVYDFLVPKTKPPILFSSRALDLLSELLSGRESYSNHFTSKS